jgi:hypothetical protein
MYNIKGILCKYLISKVESAFCFATTEVWINVPSVYYRDIYGQSFKLANIPRTLILKIFPTVEK